MADIDKLYHGWKWLPAVGFHWRYELPEGLGCFFRKKTLRRRNTKQNLQNFPTQYFVLRLCNYQQTFIDHWQA